MGPKGIQLQRDKMSHWRASSYRLSFLIFCSSSGVSAAILAPPSSRALNSAGLRTEHQSRTETRTQTHLSNSCYLTHLSTPPIITEIIRKEDTNTSPCHLSYTMKCNVLCLSFGSAPTFKHLCIPSEI